MYILLTALETMKRTIHESNTECIINVKEFQLGLEVRYELVTDNNRCFVFIFKQKTACEIGLSLVGS